ncbi:MAG: DNA cytosine methyltransferase [Spirochaetaceae bacterium]|jgi:DNA (cytosine-5)-methyltransferase 1|nr:DNA cytosine methyltransferase [Spirochaetaceae bacterium]
MKKIFTVVDMFCGAGGESTGIMQAAREKDLNVRLTAINHWERAIETHAANHPGAEHLCESIEHIDPVTVMNSERVNLLWASPECTHHSVARGGRPRSDQSRASAWMVLKWLSELYVERVIIENVPEFLSWGALNANGRPIPNQKGKIFHAFISALRSLGYVVDWRILRAADYGDPTGRRRLFIQAAKGKKKILWPQITHMDGEGENFFGCKRWVAAREVIDWNLSGTSIFDRKRPLADNTLRRITSGIKKYWGNCAEPFLAVLYGSNDTRSIDLPFPTVTTSGAHHALITPFITRYHGSHTGGTDGDKRNHSIEQPIPSLDTSNRYGIIKPFILPNEGYYRGNKAHGIDKPIGAVAASRGYGALITGGTGLKLDICFRMLKPHELKLAQGFPADYKILGTAADQMKQIGNAVPVNTAKALGKAILMGV